MVDFGAYVSKALGRDVATLRALSGGDVAEAFAVQLDDGTRVFAKTRRGAPREFFVTEAASLAWLREAQSARVPEVLHVSNDPPALILEWIESGRPNRTTDIECGRMLADLHATGAPGFGRQDCRTTGSRGLPNDPCDTWVEFYATRRLLPLARLAADADALPRAAIAELESVAQRLDELGGPSEPPARLHGDLWGGNRLIGSGGTNWLIDPAAHGGHREFDLAMMRLFGGFTEACFEAYAGVSPLAQGWRERVGLHQLAPLVVHAIKFGGGYAAATRAALDGLR